MTTAAPNGDHKDEQKPSWVVRARGLLENSAFISTVIVAIVAIFAYKATVGQLNTARLQLIATDRPWIKINTINNVKLAFESDSVELDGELEFENVGKSPALDVETIYELVVEDIYIHPKDVSKFCQYGRGADDFLGNAIFPNDTLKERVSGASLRKNSIINKIVRDARTLAIKMKDNKVFDPKSVNHEVSSFALVVCARYKIDQDERRHYTAQVFSISPKARAFSTGNTKNLPDFNLNQVMNFDPDTLIISRPKENRYAN